MKRISLITLTVILSAFVITADAYGAPKRSPEPSRDVAVTNMSAPSSCVQGDTVSVVVNVENQGDSSEEVHVTLTDVTNGLEIGSKPVTLLANGMDEVADIIFTGETPGKQQLGNYLYAGDVNADGYDDLLVAGVSRYNDCQGRVYLHLGGPNMDNLPDKILTGDKPGDYLGQTTSIGDVNGDDYPDVIVGAPGYNNFQGCVYVLFGGTSMDDVPDLIIRGKKGTSDRFGRTITVADVNKDGFVDVFITADYANSKRGQVFLFYGGNPTDAVVDKTFDGEDENDRFGLRMTAGGDVNGDGYDDVIIGAEYAPNGNAKGKAYLFYGAPGISMDRNPDKIFIGEANGDRFGNVQLLADIDKDGFADVLIGAPHLNRCKGRAYLYWGDTEANMNVNADVIFTGEGGRAKSGLGDYIVCGYFNNDDYLDIVIGAYTYYNYDKRGKVYIFNGNRRLDMDAICDFTLVGEDKGSRFGNMLAVGDFNGDDSDDLAVGGWGYNDAQGRCWLYYGNPNDSTQLRFNWNTIDASPGKHVLRTTIAPVAGEEDTADNSRTLKVNVKSKVKEK